MKNEKRLSDVTRETSTNRVNKFAASLMPAAPKPRVEPAPEPEPQSEPLPIAAAIASQIDADQPSPEAVSQQQPATPVVPEKPKASAVESTPKPERNRKNGGFTVEDLVSMPVKEGEVFNKMVRVTDDQHELLRLIAFKSRKPMNTIVHNLIKLLEQAHQKEGGDNV